MPSGARLAAECLRAFGVAAGPLGEGAWRALQWARVHDCPWNEENVCMHRLAPGCVAVGAAAQLPDNKPADRVCTRRSRRPPRGDQAGSGRERAAARGARRRAVCIVRPLRALAGIAVGGEKSLQS